MTGLGGRPRPRETGGAFLAVEEENEEEQVVVVMLLVGFAAALEMTWCDGDDDDDDDGSGNECLRGRPRFLGGALVPADESTDVVDGG